MGEMERVEIGEREEEQKTRPSGRSGVLDGLQGLGK